MGQEGTQELRQRGRKGVGQEEEAQGSHHILPGVQESVKEYEGVNLHTPKATPILGDGVPKLQRAISGAKIQWLVTFFISLENF
jgi:hypothetical protein